ncbi:MAG: hypothetical protein ACP5SB_02985 [Caldisericaceae bacterium]
MEERVIEVIPGNWKKGIFKSESWAIIVTNERLIFAKWTQDLFNKEAQRRKEESKESGSGKLKQFFSQMSASLTYFDKYYDMQPDEVSKEHPENFALRSEDITTAKLKRGVYRDKSAAIINVRIQPAGSSNVEDLSLPHELTLITNSNKIVFQFNKNFVKAKEALGTVVRV